MSPEFALLLAALGILPLAALWLALGRRREQEKRLRRAIESAGYELAHGANAVRAHLIALELEQPHPAGASHLQEIRRALERIERAAAMLTEALKPESAASPGSNSAQAPPGPA